MSIAEDWERLKTEVQQDAERLIARGKGSEIKERIKADLKAMLLISDPSSEHELTARRQIFDLLRTEWRTSVMDNMRFQKKQSGD